MGSPPKELLATVADLFFFDPRFVFDPDHIVNAGRRNLSKGDFMKWVRARSQVRELVVFGANTVLPILFVTRL